MIIYDKFEKTTKERLEKLNGQLKTAEKKKNKKEIFRIKMQIQKLKEKWYIADCKHRFNG